MNDPIAWMVVNSDGREAFVTADPEIAELRGQAVVLRRLLADALAVLRTIEPDDTDEAERLESLCAAVALALQPKREGTLL